MIHPEVQKVIDYPDTSGKRIALQQYNWQSLTKYEEVSYASRIIELARMIDNAG